MRQHDCRGVIQRLGERGARYPPDSMNEERSHTPPENPQTGAGTRPPTPNPPSGEGEGEVTALWLLGRVPQDVLPWPLLRAERAGREPGPDVREAVFLRDGVAVAGDVEVHLPASDSRRHGHEGDPAYDGVMLHLVWEDDLGHAVPLAGGGSAPTVAIGPAPPTPEQLQARLHLGPLLPPPCAALAAARPAEPRVSRECAGLHCGHFVWPYRQIMLAALKRR